MKIKKSKGFTLMELLSIIIILSFIAIITVPIILNLIIKAKKEAFIASSYSIVQAAKNNFIEKLYYGEYPQDVVFTYNNGIEVSSPNGYVLNYGGEKPRSGQVSLKSTGKVAITLYNGTWCSIKNYDDAKIIISEVPVEECVLEQIIPNEDVYDIVKGVNKPQLVTGMIPVKWNSTTNKWDKVQDPNNDTNWYDYNNRIWANAVTNDCSNPNDYSTCSMWVWIPRYAYKIMHGYHSNALIGSTGNIDIKFLKNNSNITGDGTLITSALTNNQTSADVYVKHPAFAFGSSEVSGIWVAKFEPSVDQNNVCYTTSNLTNCNISTIYPKFIPYAKSWRWNTIATSYTASRNMESNSNPYGWSSIDVDTHMMKNIEWGATAYLSVSQYGNSSKMWNNPNNEFYTGCAGKNANDTDTSTCNQYYTESGVKTSTTGNVYGVYDMSGGASERMMANYGNYPSNSNLDPVSINDKYIDRYTGINYGYNGLKYGDAIYETSNGAVYNGSSWLGNGTAAWDTNSSYMPYTDMSWFARGGTYASGGSNGPFAYINYYGGAYIDYTFRVTVIIK